MTHVWLIKLNLKCCSSCLIRDVLLQVVANTAHLRRSMMLPAQMASALWNRPSVSHINMDIWQRGQDVGCTEHMMDWRWMHRPRTWQTDDSYTVVLWQTDHHRQTMDILRQAKQCTDNMLTRDRPWIDHRENMMDCTTTDGSSDLDPSPSTDNTPATL